MKNNFYINSFPYEVELTARLCHENAKRLLETITTEISIDEFSILDTLTAKPGLSQADLARLILKGKAHTGRFLMALEEKGLIERHVAEKDGKLIKVATVTEKGATKYKKILTCLKPSIGEFEKVISDSEIQNIKHLLKTFRERIEKTSKIVFE
jgi:DNA-binding MarR family transcriptional regulator